MSSIETRSVKADKGVGINGMDNPDTLTDEGRKETRTMRRTAMEAGVPLLLPADGPPPCVALMRSCSIQGGDTNYPKSDKGVSDGR